MRLDPAEALRRVQQAMVARLATVTPDGRPHIVPVCFALLGDTAYSAVDAKPKTTPALARLDNISAGAALLVDHYEDDWSRLWWVRLDGRARLVDEDSERAGAVAALREKYPQYLHHDLSDAVIAIDVTRWTGWAAVA